MNERNSILKLKNVYGKNVNISINDKYVEDDDNNDDNIGNDAKHNGNNKNNNEDEDDGNNKNNDDHNNFDSDPIKHLQIFWKSKTYYGSFPSSPPVEFNAIWQLSHIERLQLGHFFFASFKSTTTSTTETETASNNNDKNNNDDDDDTTTTTMLNSISIGNLSKTLKELYLSDCFHPNFHLPPDIGMLSNLTRFEISGCRYLESLPVEIGNLSNLQQLELSWLHKIQSIPCGMFDNLKTNLKELVIANCESLEQLPNEIGNLEHLQKLEIDDCENLDPSLLPIELNNLCNNLKSLTMCDVGRKRQQQRWRQSTTTDDGDEEEPSFTLSIRRFTKLQELKIDWDIFSKGLKEEEEEVAVTDTPLSLQQQQQQQQTAPLCSLEKLELCHFDEKDLNVLIQKNDKVPNGAIKEENTTTTTTTTTMATKNSSLNLFSLLTCNIKELVINDDDDSSENEIPVNKVNQGVIQKIVEKFPRLFIRITSNCSDDMNLQDEESLGLFTKESLCLMSFNCCGRILFVNGHDANDNHNDNDEWTTRTKMKRPFPLSMWPMVLEQVSRRLVELENKEIEDIMAASVTFLLLQGPALMQHPDANTVFYNDNNDNKGSGDRHAITTTTTTTTTMTATMTAETTNELKRPFPFDNDGSC